MKLKIIVFLLSSLSLSQGFAKDLFVIKDIRVEGLKVIDPTTVFGYMPIKIGDKFTDTKGEQIIKKLYSTGYFEDIQVETLGNNVLINIVERPIVSKVNIKGGKAISNKDLTTNFEKFGLAPSKVFNPSLLNQLIYSLKQEYIARGKNQADIKYELVPLERHRVEVNININEGKTTKIKNVNFEGNKTFSSSKLRRQIKLSKKSVLTFLSKRDLFSPEKMMSDQQALTDFYHNNGFVDFRILDLGVNETPGNQYGLDLKIILDEGARYKWGDISINGNVEEVPLKELDKIIKHRKKKFFIQSKYFNKSYLDEIIQNVKDKLGEYGYANAVIDAQMSKDEENKKVNFVLNITPNRKVNVRNIEIVGNNKTRDEVIRREFRQLESATYNEKKIKRSKERIDNLGFFEDTKITPVPVVQDNAEDLDEEDVNKDSSNNLVDLNVEVKERQTGTLDASIGYVQDDGVVLQAGFSQDNLFGTGKALSVRLVTGGSNKTASFSFTNPYFTKDNVSLTYDLFARSYDPNKIDTSSYKIKQFGGGLTFGVPITEYDTINLGVAAKHTKLTLNDRSPIYYRIFVKENGNSFNLYTANLGWVRNTTDSLLWPTKGYILDAKLEAAIPGSRYKFYSLSHGQTWFLPITNNLTFMVKGDAGFIQRYGKTKEVPFFHNFYGGGLGSVRGYDSNSLGPKVNDWYGSVDFLGGTRMTNLTFELLFPFFGMTENKNVRMSAFVDAGSVWDGKYYNTGIKDDSSAENIKNLSREYIEYEGPHHSTFKSELRYSVGLAFTWLSPIGPLKFSYGFPLKKGKGDRFQRFQFQVGTTF